MTGNENFRQPTDVERQIVEKLLTKEFKGRDDLIAQLSSALVTNLDNYGSLKFKVNGPVANVPVRVPVEGLTKDSDGIEIFLLLHVMGGYLDELEIYKGDLSAIKTVLSLEDIQVL
jgi:hypothetical protein